MQPIEKISITMPPEMMHILRECVAAGEFASTSEVIRDAVRVWQRQRAEDHERLLVIRSRIRRSLDDPRPNLNLADVDEALETLFATAEEKLGHALSED